MEHQATGVPINLVLPVLTRPEVVQQAVAGILSGQVGLSLSNVEALLVLANAVGVSQTALSALLQQHCSYPCHLTCILVSCSFETACLCAVCSTGDNLCEVPLWSSSAHEG